jgi:hypothetical protein
MPTCIGSSTQLYVPVIRMGCEHDLNTIGSKNNPCQVWVLLVHTQQDILPECKFEMVTIDCMPPVCVVCEAPFDTITTVERGRICRPCFIQVPPEISECTDCGRKDDGTLTTLGHYSTGGYRDSICHDCRLEGNLESFIIYKEDESDTYCFYCGNNHYPEHLEQHHDPMHRLSLVTCTSCSQNHSHEIDLFRGGACARASAQYLNWGNFLGFK